MRSMPARTDWAICAFTSVCRDRMSVKMILQWVRDHVLPHRSTELPWPLREASHRIANESMKLRQEVVHKAGGYAAYERKAQEIRDVAESMLERVKQ